MALDDGFCKVSDFGLGCIPFMAGVRLWVCQEDRRPYVDALWNARVSRARAHPVQGTRQGCGLVSLITPLIASLIAPLIATLIIDFSVVAPCDRLSDRFSDLRPLLSLTASLLWQVGARYPDLRDVKRLPSLWRREPYGDVRPALIASDCI